MRQGGGWSELPMATARKGRKIGEEASLTGGRRLAGGAVQARGRGAFLYPRSWCHRWDGSGFAWRLPELGTAERSHARERRDEGGVHACAQQGRSAGEQHDEQWHCQPLVLDQAEMAARGVGCNDGRCQCTRTRGRASGQASVEAW
jgi:hypothetical protein